MFTLEQQQEAFKRVSEEFKGVPTRTVILIPELVYAHVFGNLECGSVLTDVAADKAGRLWMHDREQGALVMIFDPRWLHPSKRWHPERQSEAA